MPTSTPHATWGNWYWPIWIVLMLLTLLGPEVYALFSNVHNTQSYWVWRQLGILEPGSTKVWTWLHFIAFGAWLTVTVWLTGHFFFRLWT